MSLRDFIIDKPTLHTEQLTLRPLTAADAEDLRE